MSTLDDLNEDWIKTLAWDLPDDLDGFLRLVGDRSDVEHFMTLPAAMAMPVGLRLDIEHWLGGHPTDSPAAPAPTGVPRPPVISASVTASGITFESAATAEFYSEDQPRDDRPDTPGGR